MYAWYFLFFDQWLLSVNTYDEQYIRSSTYSCSISNINIICDFNILVVVHSANTVCTVMVCGR